MAKRHEPPIQSEEIRETIRQADEHHEVWMALCEAQGSVKTHLPAIAFDEYGEMPDETRMVYDPESHSIVVDLPEPE